MREQKARKSNSLELARLLRCDINDIFAYIVLTQGLWRNAKNFPARRKANVFELVALFGIIVTTVGGTEGYNSVGRLGRLGLFLQTQPILIANNTFSAKYFSKTSLASFQLRQSLVKSVS